MTFPLLKQIKIYSDGAEKKAMLEMAKLSHIQGFTTNPSLMRKGGVTDYVAWSKDILIHIQDRPISFEVFADDFNEMHRQALEIASWGKNVYVKIPVTNSTGQPSAELIHKLSHKGVKLNVTALFTIRQTLEVCAALKGGAPAVVSVFAGRIADTGRDPIPLMAAALEICRDTGKDVELLWASPRELLNIIQADQIGCPIITVSPEMLKKLNLLGKDLTDFSLETVQMFKTDAEAVGYKI